MMHARFSWLLALIGAVALSAPTLVVPGPDGEALAQRRERRKPPETKKATNSHTVGPPPPAQGPPGPLAYRVDPARH